ncbi:YafY family transcriptional regulator [Rhodococcus xishaensis]|uniref:YafY family transcriptional regulator n=1 Tax=Rhodococcus xishaensis TaxID=2487364 RepID=A0A3S3DWQ3_9NOCA|nr:YafY family protein [Rhodococcus xishaensis]RVW00796.1 YafY family transcriptional regulator [Rhodococcus xishaensis]
MRADRLLSLVLLLRNRGRMSASALARELEVSPRTVLRDIDALSTAGIPVYAERGRDGGFELLPGFTTDLTGLTADEAKALMTASSAATSESLGMGPAFASAIRKVVAAIPQPHRVAAQKVAERVLVTQGTWLTDPKPTDPFLGLIQQAVFVGRRLSILYASESSGPTWRIVDPVGLIHASGRWYLVATDAGRERAYRVEKIEDVRQVDEAAVRQPDVDLGAVWERLRTAFRSPREPLVVAVLVRAEHREELAERTLGVLSESPFDSEWVRLEVAFGGDSHAGEVLWAMGENAKVLAPERLRVAMESRARRMADLYE